ncbi:MAG: EF-hand domain-containing protein [Gemmataceae bacterium]
MAKWFGSGLLFASLGLFLAAASGQEPKTGGKGVGKKADVESMFKKLDADGNGKISREEFLKLAEKAPDAGKQEKAREFLGKVFDKFGKGGDLTLDQLKKFQDSRSKELKKK